MKTLIISICAISLLACGSDPLLCEEGTECWESTTLGKADAPADAPKAWGSDAEPLCQITDPDVLALADTLKSEAGDWFNSPKFQSLLDQQTNSKAYDGNEVSLLVNGINSYERRFSNLAAADVVMIKVYNFRDDTTGQKVVDSLLERLEQGATVFVQFDLKGYHGKRVDKLTGIAAGILSPIPDLLKPIIEHENGFVIPSSVADTVSELNPIWGKDHEKYFITWTRGQPVKTIMGGMNIGDEWAYGGEQDKPVPALHDDLPGFRDTDVEVLGPVNEAIIAEFLADANYHANAYIKHISSIKGLIPNVKKAKKSIQNSMTRLAEIVAEISGASETALAPQEADAKIRLVTNLPPGQDEGLEAPEGQYIEKLLCLLMSAAPRQTEVKLSSGFFLPPDTFLAALTDSFTRGVNFSMLLNGEDAVEKGFTMVAKRARCLFTDLYNETPTATSAVQLYEWNPLGCPEVSSLHHKIWSIGRGAQDPFIVGSSNLDFHSLRRNSEGVLLIQAPAVKPVFDQMMDQDFGELQPQHSSELPDLKKCAAMEWNPLNMPDSWL